MPESIILGTRRPETPRRNRDFDAGNCQVCGTCTTWRMSHHTGTFEEHIQNGYGGYVPIVETDVICQPCIAWFRDYA